MHGNTRFCNQCDYAISTVELQMSRVDFPCPRCGKENMIGNVYRYGSKKHKERRRLWELDEVKGSPLPVPEGE